MDGLQSSDSTDVAVRDLAGACTSNQASEPSSSTSWLHRCDRRIGGNYQWHTIGQRNLPPQSGSWGAIQQRVPLVDQREACAHNQCHLDSPKQHRPKNRVLRPRDPMNGGLSSQDVVDGNKYGHTEPTSRPWLHSSRLRWRFRAVTRIRSPQVNRRCTDGVLPRFEGCVAVHLPR